MKNRFKIFLIVVFLTTLLIILATISNVNSYSKKSILDSFNKRFINNSEHPYFSFINQEYGINKVIISEHKCYRKTCELYVLLNNKLETFTSAINIILKNESLYANFYPDKVRSVAATKLSIIEFENLINSKKDIEENKEIMKSKFTSIEEANKQAKENIAQAKKYKEVKNFSQAKNFTEVIDFLRKSQTYLLNQYGTYENMPKDVKEEYDYYESEIQRIEREEVEESNIK